MDLHPADDLASVALLSGVLAHPHQRPSRRGVPGGHATGTIEGSVMKAIPGTPG
jgi:hypothetical protein